MFGEHMFLSELPLARRLIEKVTIYDEKIAVEFKSGLTVEVEA